MHLSCTASINTHQPMHCSAPAFTLPFTPHLLTHCTLVLALHLHALNQPSAALFSTCPHTAPPSYTLFTFVSPAERCSALYSTFPLTTKWPGTPCIVKRITCTTQAQPAAGLAMLFARIFEDLYNVTLSGWVSAVGIEPCYCPQSAQAQ
jgi:hypothetical protein